MLEIVIWISPVDIEDLEKSLNRLKEGQQYLSQQQKDNIRFNVVLCVSDDIIDWSKSLVTKEECIERFYQLKPLIQWANKNSTFEPTEVINGCTSMRRISSYSGAKHYLWLDTDIIYDPLTLPHMINAIETVEQSGYTKYVITPEIVRQWDVTWDCLVNEKFINKPIGYQAKNNPYEDAKIGENILLEEMTNTIPNQPYMKFGGGWFAVISRGLLDRVPFPENYGHYGLDDTYLMWGAYVVKDVNIKQFKLKNVVVCENYFDRITTYKGKIQFIDRREEYKKINENLFNIGINNLAKNG